MTPSAPAADSLKSRLKRRAPFRSISSSSEECCHSFLCVRTGVRPSTGASEGPAGPGTALPISTVHDVGPLHVTRSSSGASSRLVRLRRTAPRPTSREGNRMLGTDHPWPINATCVRRYGCGVRVSSTVQCRGSERTATCPAQARGRSAMSLGPPHGQTCVNRVYTDLDVALQPFPERRDGLFLQPSSQVGADEFPATVFRGWRSCRLPKIASDRVRGSRSDPWAPGIARLVEHGPDQLANG